MRSEIKAKMDGLIPLDGGAVSKEWKTEIEKFNYLDGQIEGLQDAINELADLLDDLGGISFSVKWN
jgi:ABC-type transporter Mla subunit MlaD